MKCSKSEIHRKTHGIPEIQFEDQKLTSYAGLVLFQPLFGHLNLKQRLVSCFRHRKVSPIYGHGLVVLILIVHLAIGYRRLQDVRYYQDDPMVRRVLGIARLPDVATLSRTLAGMDLRGVDNLRQLNRQLVTDRPSQLRLPRVTLDSDGSVISTGRFAEGTADGFNRKKKGQRSYYPLFCTLAQTGQILDVWHRPGNVHDSNGAEAFIRRCIVEERKRWYALDAHRSFIETQWKPNSWDRRHRFVCVRQRSRIQQKGPVQLNLFVPYDYGYDFKVIVTNKSKTAKKVLRFHNGRGAQEGLFAELKTQTQMDYVPTKNQAGNQVFLLAAMMAHNLNRELQMQCVAKSRNTTEKRAALWQFEQLGTLRRKIIQRAGRLTRPKGKLTLTMSANSAVKEEILHYLEKLSRAA